jgi:hypothetical protein
MAKKTSSSGKYVRAFHKAIEALRRWEKQVLPWLDEYVEKPARLISNELSKLPPEIQKLDFIQDLKRAVFDMKDQARKLRKTHKTFGKRINRTAVAFFGNEQNVVELKKLVVSQTVLMNNMMGQSKESQQLLERVGARASRTAKQASRGAKTVARKSETDRLTTFAS